MANPYDEGVKRIAATIANSRFTRTPIAINGPLPASKNGFYAPQNQESEGFFWTNPENRIDINLGQNPNYNDFNRILHHEDIHALLNQSGNLTPNYDAGGLIDKLKNLFSIGSLKAAQTGFQQSGRVGESNREIPAYAGAYQQGELPGVSESNANDITEIMRRILGPEEGQKYQRIVNSVKASKQK